MKKKIFAAAMALCLMAGTSVFAQQTRANRMPKERPTAEQMAQRMTDRMTQELKLTDAQTKQVYDLNLQQVKQMQEHRDQMRAARKAEAAKMKTILTSEQYEQWTEMEGPMYGAHKKACADGKRGDCKDGKKCPKERKCGKGGRR